MRWFLMSWRVTEFGSLKGRKTYGLESIMSRYMGTSVAIHIQKESRSGKRVNGAESWSFIDYLRDLYDWVVDEDVCLMFASQQVCSASVLLWKKKTTCTRRLRHSCRNDPGPGIRHRIKTGRTAVKAQSIHGTSNAMGPEYDTRQDQRPAVCGYNARRSERELLGNKKRGPYIKGNSTAASATSAPGCRTFKLQAVAEASYWKLEARSSLVKINITNLGRPSSQK